MKLNTYLHFNDGKCRQAFELYARVLNGKIENAMTYGQMPMDKPAPDNLKDKVAHARLVIGDQVLMGSDSPPEHAQPLSGFSVNIGTDDPKEADRIYKALSEGGEIRMAIQETFWAHRFGMFVDRFGTPWMVNCEKRQSMGKAA